MCIRQVIWNGKIETINMPFHSLAYMGQVLCTGAIKCLFCGKTKEEIEKEETKQ